MLTGEVLPFWLPRAIDGDLGGYLISPHRDGTLVGDEKSIWQQGRFSWLPATPYIRDDFIKPDIACVVELVATDGSIIDPSDGRTLNPGHAIG